MLRKVDKKTKERERERVDLGFDRAIEMVKKEEVKEIKEAETMLLLLSGGGVVWSTTKKLLYESLRIRYGAVHLALVLHLEPAELIGRHVVPTVGELEKRFFHVRRWHHLAHLELPAEPQHLVLVARHFFYFYPKPNTHTLSLALCLFVLVNYQKEREIDVQFLIKDICIGRVSERERWAII